MKIFCYSPLEFAFIALVMFIPAPVAYFWAETLGGFLGKYFICMAAGLVIWLLVMLATFLLYELKERNKKKQP
jgi:hypothetical protein